MTRAGLLDHLEGRGYCAPDLVDSAAPTTDDVHCMQCPKVDKEKG